VLFAMGLRSTGLLAACTLPLLLTAARFAGPLAMDALDGALLSSRRLPSAAMAVRNFAAAPLTEELCFRCGLVSYLILGGTSPARCIWLSPALFGAAHLHHALDLVRHQGWALGRALAASAFQFGYTLAFGWLAAFLLLRTGHLAAAVAAHVLCNFMGFPRFGDIVGHPHARLVGAIYAAGIAAFALLLFPLTAPRLYGFGAGDSYPAQLAAFRHAGADASFNTQ
jgi:prenyl protein peptidase